MKTLVFGVFIFALTMYVTGLLVSKITGIPLAEVSISTLLTLQFLIGIFLLLFYFLVVRRG